jgi:ribose 5-phosphate isomerase B
LGPSDAEAIVRAFLRTEFEGGRHARRIGQITEMESDRDATVGGVATGA